MKILTGRQARPQRVLLYGVEGIGKSTLASQFPAPIFLDFEDRLAHLDVARIPIAEFDDAFRATAHLETNKHGYRTCVVDTIDWAETRARQFVCRENDKPSIESFGYGKGYVNVMEEMQRLLSALHGLQYNRGMHIVLVGHAKISKFEDPQNAVSYDRYSLKLRDASNTSIAAMFREWSDAVLFCNYDTLIKVGKDGVTRAAAGHARMIHTSHTAAFDAKNSYGLPDTIPMEYAQLKPFIEIAFDQQPAPQTAPVDGDVAERKRQAEIAYSLASRIGGKARVQAILKERKQNWLKMSMTDVLEFVEEIRSLAMAEAKQQEDLRNVER